MGVGILYMTYKTAMAKRLIEDTPLSKIRSIAMGFVKISGEAQKAKEILKSPLSGKDSVYYRCDVDEQHTETDKDGHTRTYWKTIFTDRKAVPFFVKDATGSVLVDSADANISVSISNQYNSSMGKDPPANVMRFLKEKNVKFEGFLGINKTMRYQEFMIQPKDKLYIMGTAGDNPYFEEGTAKKSEEDIMIQAGNNKRSYLISSTPEAEILKRYRLIIIIGSIIGGLFTLGSMMYLLMFSAFLG
jgi:hypothetical protein